MSQDQAVRRIVEYVQHKPECEAHRSMTFQCSGCGYITATRAEDRKADKACSAALAATPQETHWKQAVTRYIEAAICLLMEHEGDPSVEEAFAHLQKAGRAIKSAKAAVLSTPPAEPPQTAYMPIMHMYDRHMYDLPGKTVGRIPMSVFAPHEAQALINHGQSLEKLASRGGVDPTEAVAILSDRKWQEMPLGEAREQLFRMVKAQSASPSARQEDDHARLIFLFPVLPVERER